MTKQLLTLLALATSLSFGRFSAQAQATLGTSPYTESFDNLGTSLPAGFSLYTGATASSLGTAPTAAQVILTPGSTTLWTATGGGFKNFASAAAGSTATTAAQTAATNRALGVRQTGSLGDPSASFVFQVANTAGRTDFALTFSLQSLDASSTRTHHLDGGLRPGRGPYQLYGRWLRVPPAAAHSATIPW